MRRRETQRRSHEVRVDDRLTVRFDDQHQRRDTRRTGVHLQLDGADVQHEPRRRGASPDRHRAPGSLLDEKRNDAPQQPFQLRVIRGLDGAQGTVVVDQPRALPKDFDRTILGDLVRSGWVVDTNLYRNYMYRTRRRYSSQGWFLVGDAADTVDPLYSTGLALATMAIQQVGAIIHRDLAGSLTEGFVGRLDRAYAGFQELGEGQVARLYDVMQAGHQCRLRMHLHVVGFFHMALPLLLNGYHTDAVGAAMMARLGRPAHGLDRQLTDFEPLIARAASRQPARSAGADVRVQSAFALNHSWFEHCRDDEIVAQSSTGEYIDDVRLVLREAVTRGFLHAPRLPRTPRLRPRPSPCRGAVGQVVDETPVEAARPQVQRD